MALTEEQHERDARIQIVLDSYLQTYIDKKPIEEILKAKKKLFEAVDKEVSEAESRAVERCIGRVRVLQKAWSLGATVKNVHPMNINAVESIFDTLLKALSQLQNKISEEKGE